MKIKDRNLSGFYRAIAKVICYLPNIEQKEIIKTLRLFIVHEAKNMYPDASNSSLSQITGISRGSISELLKTQEPLSFINKDSIVLGELWKMKNDKNIVPLKGKNSFYSIAKTILNSSYKPEACLNSLIVCQSVEFSSEGLIIKSKYLDLYPEVKKFHHLVNKVVERYIDTLIYNFNAENHKKLFDQTYSTSKTSPEKIKVTHTQIKEYLNKVTYPQIQKIIDSNESDVSPGTFPVYSLSIFEYLGGKFKL